MQRVLHSMVPLLCVGNYHNPRLCPRLCLHRGGGGGGRGGGATGGAGTLVSSGFERGA